MRHNIIVGVLGIIVLINAYMSYLALWPPTLVDIVPDAKTIELTKKVYTKNETVEIPVSWCVNKASNFTLSRNVINSIVYPLKTINGKINSGCYTKVLYVSLPSILPASTYYITYNFKLQPNAIRSEVISFSTTRFELVD